MKSQVKPALKSSDELDELLELAMYREVASQALYIAGQRLTRDTGAVALMQQLAAEEALHLDLLKKLKEKKPAVRSNMVKQIPDLKISEYLAGGNELGGAGLQDTLSYAIKKEQQSLEFYTRLMSVFKTKSAKLLCERLARAELGHKYRLEVLYDNIFYSEN